MNTMTGKERITNILKHQPVDRIGLYEHFWSDTYSDWIDKGKIKPGECIEDHFGLDIQGCWAFNFVADLDYTPDIVSETAETVLTRDGNGALLRRHKLHDSTPEHVDFLVKEKADWAQYIKPHFTKPLDLRRINFEQYRLVKAQAAKAGRFFVWSGVNVFELIHPICGHENMLVGMLLEPEWIEDMVTVLSDMTIEMQRILFEQEGYPDGIWYYEDMGFKAKPFMSPEIYQELIMPAHTKTINYAHSVGLPVIMHSCGFVEPLLPYMIEAGIDCLQVIEIKAGMDLLRIHEQYGDKIALMGGIDVRKLYTNDFDIITEELVSKIPIVKNGYGFVAHSDHSIPKTVDYETFKFYIDKVIELGTY